MQGDERESLPVKNVGPMLPKAPRSCGLVWMTALSCGVHLAGMRFCCDMRTSETTVIQESNPGFWAQES
jgi:hypothetical protein